MTNFCTLCDKNYMKLGLAMFQSLTMTVQGPFTLHWLCMDDETFHALTRLREENHLFGATFRNIVKLYRIADMEWYDSKLADAKNNPPSKYGTQYSQYCWCCTTYFTDFILSNKVNPEDYLMYVDSDIFFYKDPSIIKRIINGKAVGIHTHRFSGVFNDESETGWYNVGVVVFKNNSTGREVSAFWRDCLLDPTNQYYEKYGTCGDQKYLNLFPRLWPGHVSIFDEGEFNGERCGHLAPWNSDNLVHPARHIIVNQRDQHEPVVFFHFSHFNMDSTGNMWKDSLHGEWNPSKDVNVKKYYEEYFNVIQQVNDLLW